MSGCLSSDQFVKLGFVILGELPFLIRREEENDGKFVFFSFLTP